MGDHSSRENTERAFSSVRLVYSADPLKSDTSWLDTVDRCTRLVLHLKEDQLLSGVDLAQKQELFEMEALGFLPFEDEEVEEEE